MVGRKVDFEPILLSQFSAENPETNYSVLIRARA